VLTITDAYLIHTFFDLIAALGAVAGGYCVYRWRLEEHLPRMTDRIGYGYFLFLSLGSIVGAFLFGTLNLYLSGIPEIGRSIIGAIFGATLMVELYKGRRGTRGSTGYIYVIPLIVVIIIGRLGCLFSGLADDTFGVATGKAWGWDFGDQVLRHPVALYESVSMLLFLIGSLAILQARVDLFTRYGFYVCIGYYAVQRFLWEFLKPYQDIAGPLNVFQIICLILVFYSIIMIGKARYE
tara:strand:- start:7348 stop:8061 length:714 start_codon:yes stop_codon:yes gene_type:complete